MIWISFIEANPDPYPDDQNKTDPNGSGSETLFFLHIIYSTLIWSITAGKYNGWSSGFEDLPEPLREPRAGRLLQGEGHQVLDLGRTGLLGRRVDRHDLRSKAGVH